MLDREGKEVPGYKYFGDARDLPGDRNSFESEAPGNTKMKEAIVGGCKTFKDGRRGRYSSTLSDKNSRKDISLNIKTSLFVCLFKY